MIENIMEFDPSKMRINIKWTEFRKISYPFRQFIALYLHELTHVCDWIFIKKLNAQKWCNDKNPEYWPDKIQDLALKCMCLRMV